MTPMLTEVQVHLALFLEGCNEEMHNPDDQGVLATVEGKILDNNFGTEKNAPGNELIVVLSRNKNSIRVNLATLIALALKANDTPDLSKELDYAKGELQLRNEELDRIYSSFKVLKDLLRLS